MTQDYWGSAAGVVIEHRCVGQGQEPVMSTAPTEERGERESKQKTNQNMSPSAGSASEAQGP